MSILSLHILVFLACLRLVYLMCNSFPHSPWSANTKGYLRVFAGRSMRRVDPCIYPRIDPDAQMDLSPERSGVDFSSTHPTDLSQEMELKIYTTSKDSRTITQDTSEQRHENNVRHQTIAVAGLHQSCDSTILELRFDVSSYACEQIQLSINSPITQEVKLKALHQLTMNILRRAGEKHMTYSRDVEGRILRLAVVSESHRVWRMTMTYCWVSSKSKSFSM